MCDFLLQSCEKSKKQIDFLSQHCADNLLRTRLAVIILPLSEAHVATET